MMYQQTYSKLIPGTLASTGLKKSGLCCQYAILKLQGYIIMIQIAKFIYPFIESLTDAIIKKGRNFTST